MHTPLWVHAICSVYTVCICKKHMYFAQTNTFWEKTTHNEAKQYAYKAPPQNVLYIYHDQSTTHVDWDTNTNIISSLHVHAINVWGQLWLWNTRHTSNTMRPKKFQLGSETMFANNRNGPRWHRVHTRWHHLRTLQHVCRTLHNINVLWVFVCKWTLVPSIASKVFLLNECVVPLLWITFYTTLLSG